MELIRRDGPSLYVRGLDMLDGTQILDIKPYLSSVAPEKLRGRLKQNSENRDSPTQCLAFRLLLRERSSFAVSTARF